MNGIHNGHLKPGVFGPSHNAFQQAHLAAAGPHTAINEASAARAAAVGQRLGLAKRSGHGLKLIQVLHGET